jgi:hypothetical protein
MSIRGGRGGPRRFKRALSYKCLLSIITAPKGNGSGLFRSETGQLRGSAIGRCQRYAPSPASQTGV